MQFFQIKKFMVNKAIKLNGVVNSNPAIMKKKKHLGTTWPRRKLPQKQKRDCDKQLTKNKFIMMTCSADILPS